MRRLISIVFLLAIALIFWTPPVAAETYTVKMGSDTGQLKFVPETLEIKSGDTVPWVNNQIPPHNVIFEGNKVPNGDKALADKISHKKLLFTKGDSFETTFSDAAAGSYSYYCQPHRGAGMVGKIIVQD